MSLPVLTYRDTGTHKVVVDLNKLIATKLLIQAGSGGGKSWAIRNLAEETFGRVPQIIIDPEGEFHTLREKYDYVLAARRGGDVEASAKTAPVLARRLIEASGSAVLDLSEMKPDEQRAFVKVFLQTLLALPRELWRSTLVIIDEVQIFAPESGHGQSESLDVVADFSARSRKRGFCFVAATQRLAKFHKDVVANLHNKLIGLTTLDTDMDRAGRELGFSKDDRESLRKLDGGDFFAYGPAISKEIVKVRTGPVKTTHPQPGQTIAAATVPPSSKVKALIASSLADLPKEAEEEARSITDLQQQVRQLKGDLTRAQRAVGVADPADVQRQIVAGVERAGRTWAKDLRRLVSRDLDRLAKSIDLVSGTSDRLLTQISDSKAAFLSLDSSFGDGADREVAIPKAPERPPVAASRPRSTPVAQRSPRPGSDYTIVDASLSNPQQRMLDALKSFEAIGVEQLAKSHVAVYSDQSSRSSGFRNNLSVLSAKGLVERVDSDTVRLTEAGRLAGSAEMAPATLEDLHAAWLEKLTGPQRLMLSLLLEAYPKGIDRDDLASQSGQSPLSSGYRNNLSVLNSLGLTRKESGEILAGSLLYPEGL